MYGNNTVHFIYKHYLFNCFLLLTNCVEIHKQKVCDKEYLLFLFELNGFDLFFFKCIVMFVCRVIMIPWFSFVSYVVMIKAMLKPMPSLTWCQTVRLRLDYKFPVKYVRYYKLNSSSSMLMYTNKIFQMIQFF